MSAEFFDENNENKDSNYESNNQNKNDSLNDKSIFDDNLLFIDDGWIEKENIIKNNCLETRQIIEEIYNNINKFNKK